LNYFSEIKEIKRPTANPLARKSSVLKALDSVPGAFAASDRAQSSIYFSRPVEHLFSRHVAEREGVVKSLGSSSGDRGAARAYPEIVKLFLGDCLAMSLRIASFEEPMDVGAEADASRVQASTAQPNSYSGR